ncbi:MAG: hypothetical protein WDW38_006268 [Sanguina aurantia]
MWARLCWAFGSCASPPQHPNSAPVQAAPLDPTHNAINKGPSAGALCNEGNAATASGLAIVTNPPAPSPPVLHNDKAEPTELISHDTASASASAGTHTSAVVQCIPSSASRDVASQSSSAVDSAAVTAPTATARIPPQPLNADVPAVLNPPERRSSRAVQPQQDNKLHIALSNLQFHELIGSSPNKALYRGSWNHTSVGISVFRFSGVVANAQTLQRLSSHPNLVQFYRWTTAEHGQSTCLVTELVRMGELDSLLVQYGSGLHNRSKLLMCEQVASAMCELVKEGVTHGSLCSHNVLAQSLDPVHVKVSDFEMACILSASDGAAAARLTSLRVRTTAPEVLAGGCISEKSDVWSFGLLLWVICSNGATPFSDLTSDEQVRLAIQDGKRLLRPSKCPKQVWELMQQCWHHDPDQRPLFLDITQTFERWRSNFSISRHKPHPEAASGGARSPSVTRAAFRSFTVSAPDNIQCNPTDASSPEVRRLMQSDPFMEVWDDGEHTSSSESLHREGWLGRGNQRTRPQHAHSTTATASSAALRPHHPRASSQPQEQQHRQRPAAASLPESRRPPPPSQQQQQQGGGGRVHQPGPSTARSRPLSPLQREDQRRRPPPGDGVPGASGAQADRSSRSTGRAVLGSAPERSSQVDTASALPLSLGPAGSGAPPAVQRRRQRQQRQQDRQLAPQPLFLPLESFLLRPASPGDSTFQSHSLQGSRCACAMAREVSRPLALRQRTRGLLPSASLASLQQIPVCVVTIVPSGLSDQGRHHTPDRTPASGRQVPHRLKGRFLRPPSHRIMDPDQSAPPSPDRSLADWPFIPRPDGPAARASPPHPPRPAPEPPGPRADAATSSAHSSARQLLRTPLPSPHHTISDDLSLLLNSETFLTVCPSLPFIPASPLACLRDLLHSRGSRHTLVTETSSFDFGSGFERTRSAGSMDRYRDGSLLLLLSGGSVQSSRRSVRSHTPPTPAAARATLRQAPGAGSTAPLPVHADLLHEGSSGLDAQLSMDIESLIRPMLSRSDLTSPAGTLSSSGSQTAGGSSIARGRSRPLMTHPCDVCPGTTQPTRAPGPAQAHRRSSLDPSVSSCSGYFPTVLEQPPRRGRWAGGGEVPCAVTTEEAGEPSRSTHNGPPASSSGSGGAARHSSRRHHSHSHGDAPQPQHPHQQQQHHPSLGSSKQYGSKHSAATSCSSPSSAESGNAAGGAAAAAAPAAAAAGPSSGMYLHTHSRASADNSMTLSSTSISRSTCAATSTQHSERDAHPSDPPERRGSGSGGSRSRSRSALYGGNHGRLTHASADSSTRGPRPPRSSSNQMEAWEEGHDTRWRSKPRSSGSGSPLATIDGACRSPSVLVTSHYVDIASLM